MLVLDLVPLGKTLPERIQDISHDSSKSPFPKEDSIDKAVDGDVVRIEVMAMDVDYRRQVFSPFYADTTPQEVPA